MAAQRLEGSDRAGQAGQGEASPRAIARSAKGLVRAMGRAIEAACWRWTVCATLAAVLT